MAGLENRALGLDPARESNAVALAANEERVRRGFWKKLARAAGAIPFAEDAAAAYFCAADPDTPLRVRAALLAALAYFIVPTDMIPDFLAGLGYADDASVLAMALALVSSHMKPEHRDAARRALHKIPASPSASSPPPEH